MLRGYDGCDSAAGAMVEEIQATGVLKKGGNYTNIEEPDAYYHGLIGELRFEGILNEYKRRYSLQRRTDGRADILDYLVWWNGHALRLDVKTGSKPHYVKCMMPEAQYQKRRAARILPHIVVACRLEAGPHVSYHGWSKRYEVARWEVGYPNGRKELTRMQPFVDMHRIETLFEILDEAP